MEFVVQRFMVGRVGAMAELHLGPLWNIFGPPAKLLLGPRPNLIWDPTHFGARTMSQLGPGTIYIWAPRPNHIRITCVGERECGCECGREGVWV